MENVDINISINDNAMCNKDGITGNPAQGSIKTTNSVAPDTDSIDTDEMHRMMELQLHEQYAQNNNANLGSNIALIVALLSVFYGYGYVYLHSTNCFCPYWQMMIGRQFTLNALFLTVVATFFVIGILYYICFSQGIKQRMEQFISFAIRYKYFSKPQGADSSVRGGSIEVKMSDDYNRVFPEGYHPFKDLSKCCCLQFPRKLAQGLFGDLLPIISASLILIIVSLIPRIISNSNYCACHRVPIGIYIVLAVVLLAFLINVIGAVIYKINKYIERSKQYKQKLGI